tara:strand:+ start:751 stop:1329 length:579 start_codon:yes stop_codon:yes gene_type:complete
MKNQKTNREVVYDRTFVVDRTSTFGQLEKWERKDVAPSHKYRLKIVTGHLNIYDDTDNLTLFPNGLIATDELKGMYGYELSGCEDGEFRYSGGVVFGSETFNDIPSAIKSAKESIWSCEDDAIERLEARYFRQPLSGWGERDKFGNLCEKELDFTTCHVFLTEVLCPDSAQYDETVQTVFTTDESFELEGGV